jgi:hypothetical protein
MKRQRGRNRGGGGGNKPQHNVNRAFESNGPDNVKVRGNAQHVFEKYQQLARDAASSGDRVLAENYLQHAEHYFRVLRAVQPNRPASEIIGRDAFASGFDIDFEAEGDEGAEAAEGEGEGQGGETANGQGGETRFERQEREWQNRREERQGERGQGERQQGDREQRRDDRPREERGQGERQQGERQQGEPRRDDRRERRDRFRDRDRDRDFNRERPRDPMAVVEPEATPLPAAAAPAAPELDEGPRLRSQDGSVSHAPAFLQARPERAEPAAEGEARRPRRRRAPRSFEGGEGEAPAASETEEA